MTSTRQGKFVVAHSPVSKDILLFISDYNYWVENQDAIELWMTDNLPRGLDHQSGMVLTFDSEQDRLMFMLRWG